MVSTRWTAVDFGELGWQDRDRDTPELVARRDYLALRNGITGLEICEPTEIDRAVRIF